VALIPGGQSMPSHQYLLEPVSIQLKLVLNAKGEIAKEPKINAAVAIDRFVLATDEDQIQV
jgi:hypothetical protein